MSQTVQFDAATVRALGSRVAPLCAAIETYEQRRSESVDRLGMNRAYTSAAFAAAAVEDELRRIIAPPPDDPDLFNPKSRAMGGPAAGIVLDLLLYLDMAHRAGVWQWDGRGEAPDLSTWLAPPRAVLEDLQRELPAADVMPRLQVKATDCDKGKLKRGTRRIVPLTDKQRDAVERVGRHHGNIAAAAREKGVTRQAMGKHYKAGMKKLASMKPKTPKTRALPADHRGQAEVADPNEQQPTKGRVNRKPPRHED
jgi:hypothetical protein